MSSKSTKEPLQPKSPKVHESETGAGVILSDLIKTGPEKDDHTLIDVKVNNPLHRIAEILEEIKNHQSTTFDLKFTVPLVALPIFLLVAFQIGRVQITCAPQFSSKVGTLKLVSVMAPKSQPGLFSVFSSIFPSLPQLLPQRDLELTTKALLIPSTGEPLTILHDPNNTLLDYADQQVVVTGNFSSCTGSITLDSPQNISVMR